MKALMKAPDEAPDLTRLPFIFVAQPACRFSGKDGMWSWCSVRQHSRAQLFFSVYNRERDS